MLCVVTFTEAQTSPKNHDLGFLPGIFVIQLLKDITEYEFLTVLPVLHKHKPMFNNLVCRRPREITQHRARQSKKHRPS